MESIRKAFVQLHLSVLLAGFTGLFGKLITLHEVNIVWYRMLFTSAILVVFTGIPRIDSRKLWQLAGVGTLLGLHWMLFYGSIKASNISIGVICYALVGFFTAFFEPLIYRHRINRIDVGFSLITLAGLMCVFSFDSRYRYGILIGVASSAVAALYSVCNKKVSSDVRSRTALFYQMAAGLIVVTAIDPIYLAVFPSQGSIFVVPEGRNLWLLLCQALFCTVGLYILQIPGTAQTFGFHGQPDFQSRTLLYHSHCLYLLRRGTGTQLLVLRRHRNDHHQRVAANTESSPTRRQIKRKDHMKQGQRLRNKKTQNRVRSIGYK